jgi:hypothetical protein
VFIDGRPDLQLAGDRSDRGLETTARRLSLICLPLTTLLLLLETGPILLHCCCLH